MTMRMVLFCIIYIYVFYAQAIDVDSLREHYYQILLERWQKNTDWQEVKLMGDVILDSNVAGKDYYQVSDIVRKELQERYNVDTNNIKERHSLKGKPDLLEYVLVHISVFPENEQIWFLVSRLNGKILSTYKDKIRLEYSRHPYFALIKGNTSQEKEAYRAYLHLLWESTLDSVDRFPLRIPVTSQDIDSVNAIAIAIAMAEDHYGYKMTPFAAKLMGDNEEHWMVYCFPTMSGAGIKFIDIQKWERHCYNELITSYKKGNLFWMAVFARRCPTIISVLISRESGQVLSMLGEVKDSIAIHKHTTGKDEQVLSVSDKIKDDLAIYRHWWFKTLILLIGFLLLSFTIIFLWKRKCKNKYNFSTH